MNIVETIVTYKTAPREKQLADTFIDEQQAIDFALTIEVGGGVAVVTRRLKQVPQGQDFVDSDDIPRYVRRPL